MWRGVRLTWGRLAAVAGAVALLGVVHGDALAQRVGQGIAQQPGVLDATQSEFRATLATFLGPITLEARRLYALLATVQIAPSGFAYMRTSRPDEAVDALLRQFIAMSFVLMLITGAGYWLPPIVTGLAAVGQRSGVLAAPPGPSEVLDLGLRLAFGTLELSDVPIQLASILAALMGTAAQLVVLGAFTATAYALVTAWVGSYVALTGGVLFLAFGAFRGTARYAENYLNYLVFMGIRLFALYLLLGVGSTVLTRMADAIHRAPGSAGTQQMAAVVAAPVIVAGLVLRIPGNMAGRITASHSFGLVDALRGQL